MTTVLGKVWAGKSDSFALEFQAKPDPDGDGLSPGSPGSVWGATALWVGGRNVSAHIDREGGHWDAINWYIESTIQWFLDHWDGLFHEQRLPFPVREQTLVDDYSTPRDAPPALKPADAQRWYEHRSASWKRHFLVSCRAGGPAPDVAFLRRGDEVWISWSGDDVSGQGIRFLEPAGWVSIPVEEMAEILSEFIGQVLALCSRLQPGEERWSKFDRQLQSIERSGVQRTRARLGWLVGGVYGLSLWNATLKKLAATKRTRIEQALQNLRFQSAPVLRCPEPALLFGTLAPNVRPADAATLLAEWLDANLPDGETVRSPVPPVPLDARSKTFMQGYNLAAELREALGLGDEPVDDIEALFASLGIAIRRVGLSDSQIPAVALASDDTRPTVLLNENCRAMRETWVKRMALAHELCHLLHDRDRARRIAIAEGPWAPLPIEQRARAFAAYFLMPAGGVRRWIADEGVDPTEPQGLRDLADHFGVSYRAAARHLVSLEWLYDTIAADQLVDLAATSTTE